MTTRAARRGRGYWPSCAGPTGPPQRPRGRLGLPLKDRPPCLWTKQCKIHPHLDLVSRIAGHPTGLLCSHSGHSQAETGTTGPNPPRQLITVGCRRGSPVPGGVAALLGGAGAPSQEGARATHTPGGTATMTATLVSSVAAQPKAFLLSAFNEKEKAGLRQAIDELGGVTHDTQFFTPACTHVVVGYPSRSEKYLAACAAGKWVLKRSFIEASRAQGESTATDGNTSAPRIFLSYPLSPVFFLSSTPARQEALMDPVHVGRLFCCRGRSRMDPRRHKALVSRLGNGAPSVERKACGAAARGRPCDASVLAGGGGVRPCVVNSRESSPVVVPGSRGWWRSFPSLARAAVCQVCSPGRLQAAPRGRRCHGRPGHVRAPCQRGRAAPWPQLHGQAGTLAVAHALPPPPLFPSPLPLPHPPLPSSPPTPFSPLSVSFTLSISISHTVSPPNSGSRSIFAFAGPLMGAGRLFRHRPSVVSPISLPIQRPRSGLPSSQRWSVSRRTVFSA